MDWLDEIESQLDSTVPYYVPRLVAEVRRLRAIEAAHLEQRFNTLTGWMLGPRPDDRTEAAQARHRRQDPHCTCNDCIGDHAAGLGDA